VFPQIASQILQKTGKELRCPSRAWKELEGEVVKLLIQTPNAKNKCGFNTDRYVFNPTCTSPKDMKHFQFLGILFGVAMRTKKPLDLHLAQPMWKLLAGMVLTSEDIEEVCMCTCVYVVRGGWEEEEGCVLMEYR